MTRTPLSRSEGQGHQAALLTAVLARQAAAAVGVRTCWPWETAVSLPSARRRNALRRPRGDRGAGLGHTVAAPTRLQFVYPRTLTVNYNLLSIRGRLLSIPLLHLAEHFRRVSLYTCRFSFKNSTIHRTEIICLVTSKTARLISDF